MAPTASPLRKLPSVDVVLRTAAVLLRSNVSAAPPWSARCAVLSRNPAAVARTSVSPMT
jgi:hypothetical protein